MWWCRAAIRSSLAVVWHLETPRCTSQLLQSTVVADCQWRSLSDFGGHTNREHTPAAKVLLQFIVVAVLVVNSHVRVAFGFCFVDYGAELEKG